MPSAARASDAIDTSPYSSSFSLATPRPFGVHFHRHHPRRHRLEGKERAAKHHQRKRDDAGEHLGATLASGEQVQQRQHRQQSATDVRTPEQRQRNARPRQIEQGDGAEQAGDRNGRRHGDAGDELPEQQPARALRCRQQPAECALLLFVPDVTPCPGR